MAGIIKDIIGHEKQLTQLQSLVEKGHLPTSMIFNGPSGVGKKMVARAILQILLCPRDLEACGECSSCQRVFDEKNEFIFEIGLQDKKRISVDQIRQLQPFLNLASVSAARFVIIDPADQMSIQAANALLKVLEEPPEKTHFILITERFSSLLPTIRSRSQIINFNLLSEAEIQQMPAIDQQVVPWACGRPQLAQLLTDESKKQWVKEAVQSAANLLKSEPQDWKKLVPSFFANDQDREILLRLWAEIFKKALHGHNQGIEFIPQDKNQVVAMYQALQSVERDLYRNVDKLLVLENLFYKWQQCQQSPEEALWNSPANF